MDGFEEIIEMLLGSKTGSLISDSEVSPKSAASSYLGGYMYFCVRLEGHALGLAATCFFDIPGCNTTSLP
jgi:hypothetical protein